MMRKKILCGLFIFVGSLQGIHAADDTVPPIVKDPVAEMKAMPSSGAGMAGDALGAAGSDSMMMPGLLPELPPQDVTVTIETGISLPEKDPELPFELSRFYDILVEAETFTVSVKPGEEPEKPAQRMLHIQACPGAEELTDLAGKIATAPLLEMTQNNFTSWKAARDALKTATSDFAQICETKKRRGAYKGYNEMKKKFVEALGIRR